MRVGESRLDTIARGLAGGMSRREALRAGGVAFAGAVAMSPADAVAKLTGHCPKHHVHCDGKCCLPGEVCLAPKHKGGKRRCGCAHGGTRCGDKCIDVHTDPRNCGHCGHKCAAGQHCADGVCTSPTPACATGQTLCNGACVTLSSDPNNCGSCGHACGSGEVCSGGQCSATCASGETECSGGCVNLQTDQSNCGQCGKTCTGGTTCQGGSCVCPAGTAVCGGTCVDQMTDASACGPNCVDCTSLPFVQNATCSSGTCSYTCAPDWVNCSGNPADGCPCLGSSQATACNPDGTCKQM